MKKAVIGSLILSALHSILFFGKHLGISVLLFAIPCVFLLMISLRKSNKLKNERALYLSIPILLLSSTYLFFNNTFFNMLNIVVIPVLLATMIIWALVDDFKVRELFQKGVSLIIGSLEFIPGACKLAKSTFNTSKEEKEVKHKKLKLIGIGILCSLPILFIILGLLIAADGLFANLFESIFKNITYIFTSEFVINLLFRLIVIGLVFIYLLCIIYNIFKEKTSFNRKYKESEIFKLHIDSTIINTVLTIINIVYLIFTGIQFVYLYSYIFNNASLSASLNLANYARQGFFQLMFITIINFAIILLTTHNKVEEENKYTKYMNVLMCIFTIVITVSAFIRMNLYESEFGYTFLRLMVYVILITETIALIPTICYILKKKVNLFKTYIVIAVTMYVIINFANIDHLIAKNNINRAQNNLQGEYTKREIDIDYLIENLGTDSVSEIVYLYTTVTDSQDKRKINNYLYNMYQDVKEDRTWQEWNLSKDRAKKELEPLNLQYQSYYNSYDDIL